MQEKKTMAWNGFLGLLIMVLLFVVSGIGLISATPGGFIVCVLAAIAALVVWTGLFIVQPNQARAMVFFGNYKGSVREPGFFWTIPFTSKPNVSLKVRNFNSKQLKVNDVVGNPIEIAAVIVFKVTDSAKALFEVDNYMEFVEIQSETALRHIASLHPYDNYDSGGTTLRGNTDEIAVELQNDLQARLAVAGVEVMEARLTHLAYSPEIAGAMLQRQQAAAIVAAREKIVEGAVGMVQMAIDKLKADGVIDLDEERKAAMINNLMVAIVSEKPSQPIVNAGSIY
ncbi:regulator of protease activity HflC (stomatin/prohibitin superfamily) [Tumebacillus sp. BK434]|uniref:SPFH domain-containing protein n=1 Tax=Tumebacillus sp. BK434 TaxID=2512169 RepID=UPI001049C347|nr:SPFH domain-containing protein [Tumebacillus sp. BK434]TCP58219.1 regulator of protease activity HflC (stomatin/prohibitin superfamily) [Tumebacillus sp. BK434]